MKEPKKQGSAAFLYNPYTSTRLSKSYTSPLGNSICTVNEATKSVKLLEK